MRGHYDTRVGGFADDARAAMAARPDYFVWWYTAKSIALVGALAAATYFAGKAAALKRYR